MAAGGTKEMGGISKMGHHAAPRQQHPGARSPEPGVRRKIFSYICCGCIVAATGRLELAVGVTIEIEREHSMHTEFIEEWF